MTNPTGKDAEVKIHCFLSYSRDDNAAMNGIADEIKSRVEALYRAHTGREIQLFLDRTDLGWGDDWRERITDAVQSATAFIPLITMNYFNRPACREELMAFYTSADLIGVTDLILPIVLAGSRRLNSSDASEEMKIVSKLNYVSLEQTWPKGFQSPEWGTAINDLTIKLIDALDRAETRIAEREGAGQAASPKKGGAALPHTREPDEIDETDPDAPGIIDLIHEFSEQTSAFTSISDAATEDFKEFAGKIQEVMESLNAAPNRKAMNQRAVALSNGLNEVSTRFNNSASQLLVHASGADAAIRRIVSDVAQFNLPSIHVTLQEQLDNIHGFFGDVDDDILEQANQMVEMTRMMGNATVSLRRALAPGLKGMSAFRDTIQILKSWEHLNLPGAKPARSELST